MRDLSSHEDALDRQHRAAKDVYRALKSCTEVLHKLERAIGCYVKLSSDGRPIWQNPSWFRLVLYGYKRTHLIELEAQVYGRIYSLQLALDGLNRWVEMSLYASFIAF